MALNFPLLGSLVGIAIIDSLNPSLFIAQFILFATQRPVPRILAYIAGLLSVNYLGGILFVAGIRTVIENVIYQMDNVLLTSIQLIIGLALLVFGILYKAQPMSGEHSHKPPLNLWRAFLFGMVVMIQELTTALPYIVASERIATANMGIVGNLLSLLVYNSVFALPLFAFLGGYVLLRERFTAQVDRINQAIRVWTPRIMKYLSFVVGIGLTLYAIVQLSGI